MFREYFYNISVTFFIHLFFLFFCVYAWEIQYSQMRLNLIKRNKFLDENSMCCCWWYMYVRTVEVMKFQKVWHLIMFDRYLVITFTHFFISYVFDWFYINLAGAVCYNILYMGHNWKFSRVVFWFMENSIWRWSAKVSKRRVNCIMWIAGISLLNSHRNMSKINTYYKMKAKLHIFLFLYRSNYE